MMRLTAKKKSCKIVFYIVMMFMVLFANCKCTDMQVVKAHLYDPDDPDVEYEGGWDFYIDSQGIVYDRNADESIGDGYYVYGYTKDIKSDIIIPATIIVNNTTYNVTGIGESAFAECTKLQSVQCNITSGDASGGYIFQGCSNLTSISFAEGIQRLGEYTFDGCTKLTSVLLPNSVQEITGLISRGYYGIIKVKDDNPRFYGDADGNIYSKDKTILYVGTRCKKSVTLPNGVTTIKDYAFDNGSYLSTAPGVLESITMPDTVTELGAFAFWNCKNLKKVRLSKKIKVLRDSTFRDCTSLKQITIPSGVKRLELSVFTGSGLTSITIPSSVKTMASTTWTEGTFQDCKKLKKVTIKKGLKVIDNRMFEGCTALKSIKIPDSVKTIGEGAFGSCTKLQTVTIGKNVQKIKGGAFYNCIKLKEINVKSTKLKKVAKLALDNTNSKLVIKVPKKKYATYKKYFEKKGNKTVRVTY